MGRPQTMPKPRLRKGAKTYEIRVRIPEASRGGRFKGSHTTRTLSTSQRKADSEEAAYRNLPDIYDALKQELEEEAQKLGNFSIADGAREISAENSGDVDPDLNNRVPRRTVGKPLTTNDVCKRYLTFVMQNEQQTRRELTEGAKMASSRQWLDPNLRYDPVKLATEYTQNVERRLEMARARQIVRDFASYEWFLNTLERSWDGQVVDRDEALQALCRTEQKALGLLASIDSGRASPPAFRQPSTRHGPAPLNATPSIPLLSEFINEFILRRGDSLSDEATNAYRAIVRDLIEVTVDRPVSDYTVHDADEFEAVQRALPPNWRKKVGLRDLPIIQAAKKAETDGEPPQTPRNIRKKWSQLGTLFKHAVNRYGGRHPFQADMLQVDKSRAANSQWDPFAAHELAALMDSDLSGHLYWLTRLALFTGARTNELCQLTKSHVKCHKNIHYIHFSPELRLKTGEIESCVRSVPLRQELIDEGFLDYVAKAEGPLFPGMAKHTTGRYSDAIGKQFTRHLKKIELKRDKLSFKSLRHTFIAEFKRCAPRDFESRERLIGHAIQGVAGRYGNSYTSEAEDLDLLEERAKVLATLRFDF